MIRFIIIALTVVLFLVLGIPVLLFELLLRKLNPQAAGRQSLAIVKGVFRFVLKVAGTKVTVEGLENIPADRAVLYVGNHRSYFDILVGYVTVPGPTGFVAKKELLKFPLLKDWMSLVECLFLDRKDMKKGLKTILLGIEKIKSGISIWIFPEGTRSKSKDCLELLPFKEGSLKMAEKSGCPVIPVAMMGNAEIFENHLPFIRRASVKIRYGKPIYLKELEPEQKKYAGAYTRAVIIEMLKDMQRGGCDAE